MRKITKLLTLALAALMIMGAMPVSAAFTDVSVDNDALYDAVELLTTLGVAKGTSDTTFGPDELVTRQQMAAFTYRLMKAGRSSEGGVNTTPFTDLEDSTFFNMISWANSTGVIKGTSATTFNPKGNIVLQDAYVMLVRALGYEKDGALAYPNQYIDIAEEIGLDENIPSTVDYTASLTRGQVAIILANAFYADMNETTVKYEWITNPNDETKSAYVAQEKQETVAHKIFGVEEETFVVTATTHYGFDGASALYNETTDVDIVKGSRYDANGNLVVSNEEIEMADLGLDGSSDDYFMAELTLFVKKDSGDAAKDKFIAAKSNLVKKTVKAADVTFERSNKTDKEYYVGGVKKSDADKVITGYMTLGGTKAYLDANNAPYSYKKLDTVDGKEKGSVKFITLESGSYDKDNATFHYATLDNNFDGMYKVVTAADVADNGPYADYKKDVAVGSYDLLTAAVDKAFPTLYNGGIYEADVYDVNGDGYAEYIFVKNYNFVQISDKKNISFKGVSGVANDIDCIYTKDVTIEGAYAAKDTVLAYVNENAKYVKIAEKLSPVESMVKSITTNNNNNKEYTLQSGDVISTKDAAKKYASYAYADKTFTAGKTIKAYIKDGVVLYTTSTSTSGEFDADANYAIVIENKDAGKDDAEKVIYTASGVLDGKRVSYYYVDAIIDGAVVSVKLADYVNVLDESGDLDSEKITSKTAAETFMFEKFLNKYSTYTVDSEGAYTFTECNFATYTDGVYNSTTDETAVYGFASSVALSNYTGSIYEADGISGIDRFNVRDYTKFIVKSTDDDNDDVYTVYTAATLPKFDKTTFKNAKYVFVNNTKSKVENLALFYGESEEFVSKNTKDYRIVVATSETSENNKTKTLVSVIDFAGNRTNNVELASGASAAVGNYVTMKDDGKVSGKVDPASEYSNSTKFFTDDFVDYDVDNKFLTLQNNTQTFVVNDDTQILYYVSSSNYGVAEEDILTEVDNPYDDFEGVEENGEMKVALKLDIVAEKDTSNTDNADDIMIVKSIVVKKK